MNFIIAFYDSTDTKSSLVDSFQNISSVSGKVYGHDEIHSND